MRFFASQALPFVCEVFSFYFRSASFFGSYAGKFSWFYCMDVFAYSVMMAYLFFHLLLDRFGKDSKPGKAFALLGLCGLLFLLFLPILWADETGALVYAVSHNTYFPIWSGKVSNTSLSTGWHLHTIVSYILFVSFLALAINKICFQNRFVLSWQIRRMDLIMLVCFLGIVVFNDMLFSLGHKRAIDNFYAFVNSNTGIFLLTDIPKDTGVAAACEQSNCLAASMVLSDSPHSAIVRKTNSENISVVKLIWSDPFFTTPPYDYKDANYPESYRFKKFSWNGEITRD